MNGRIVLPNEPSSKDTDDTAQKIENNPDEYFDGLDDFVDADYDSIVNNAVSSELGLRQQSKVENNSDEYFNELDSLSDLDYDSIFDSAKSDSVVKSTENTTQKIEDNSDIAFLL